MRYRRFALEGTLREVIAASPLPLPSFAIFCAYYDTLLPSFTLLLGPLPSLKAG